MNRYLLLWLLLPMLGQAAEPAVDFNRDVRPILAEACFACHGFDAKARKANLRLDTAEGAYAVHDGRAAIKPNDLKASEAWTRITSNDDTEVMPPPHAKKKLTAAQKETLRQWITQGAKYAKHWSFEPITRPTPPKFNASTPIDAFLSARIQAAGLTVQPEASRELLLRRVAFALTGLPPTLKDAEMFLADKAPNAYEKMIDRYLASDRYGEEMARHWLDVARYADTHGLHLDNERQMWAYRDWVIKAFNQNLSFDQFTIWQLAGDLLPEPTQDQLIATGFNRNNVTTSEGGSIPLEFEVRYAVERTTATAQAWLGLTAGCAVCHDHKYDPVTAKDFYSLYAFFRSAADPAMDGNINVTPPFLKVPRPELKARATAAGQAEQAIRRWLEASAATTRYTDPATSKPARHAVREVLLDEALPLGATARASSRNAPEWDYVTTFKPAAGQRSLRLAHAIGSNTTIDYKGSTIIVPHDAQIEVAIHVDYLDVPSAVSLSFDANGKKTATWNRTAKGLVRKGSKTGAVEIHAGRWNTITFDVSEIGLKAGDRITAITLDQRGGVAHFDAIALRGQSDPATDPHESLSAWRTALGKTAPPDMPANVAALVAKGPQAKLDATEEATLQAFYLATIARPATRELATLRTLWAAARHTRIVAEDEAPGTFIFRDKAQPVESFIMMRGQYDKPGAKVEPAGPSVLPAITPNKPGARLNRLDLAKWLVGTENPLTARVVANRFWQQFFGTGLVRTSDDFGTQGEPPSHPELLDWLASELVAQKWDVKAFTKMLLLSEAFRRNSKLTDEVRTKDPANRLYARGPRFRLDAEQLRDNALAVSGLLNPMMGGRGVKPYQPANIWEPIGYGDSNTRYYQQDHGPALYRRSIYVFLKRTAPPPFMSNFDGPNREQVCLVRERSNTPIQALQLLNDVQFFEAARALAERTLSEGGSSTHDRLTYLFRTVLARTPEADELRLMTTAIDKQRAIYNADPEAAKKVVNAGESVPKRSAPDPEIAAWTMLANVMLNLDETLTRN